VLSTVAMALINITATLESEAFLAGHRVLALSTDQWQTTCNVRAELHYPSFYYIQNTG
jgi:hypothetical protein